MSPTGSQQDFFLTAHYGSVIWPPEDFCVLWASWFLVLGEQLFLVIVTQLIIGLGPYFTVCQAGRFRRLVKKDIYGIDFQVHSLLLAFSTCLGYT